MKQQKHLLIIRSGYPSKEFVLKKLQALGYYVIVLDTEKNCPSNLVDEWIIADLKDEDACLAAVHNYITMQGKKIDGVLTFWEEAVLVTTKIADSLDLPGIPYTVASRIKDKFAFRAFCEQNSLPAPRHVLINGDTEYKQVKEQLTFPVVVKPKYGACSAFVTRVDAADDLKKSIASIKKYIKSFWLASEWQSLDLFVEEYIEGQEVDIDMLVQDGELKFASISDNFQTHEPFFIETGQAIPSRLSPKRQNALLTMAMDVLLKMGVREGCIHFEAKSSKKGPVPIEINLRMGGDEVYSFVKNAWGVDLVENAAKIAIGETITVNKPKKPLAYLEGGYFLPDKPGIITNIIVSPELTADPRVFELRLSKKIGEKILVPPQDFDYFGWLTTKGKTHREAHDSLTELFRKVQFYTKPYAAIQSYI